MMEVFTLWEIIILALYVIFFCMIIFSIILFVVCVMLKATHPNSRFKDILKEVYLLEY